MRYLLALTLSVLIISAPTSQASAAPNGLYVPDSLTPWVNWVLHRNPEANCPFIDGSKQRQCVTYSSLQLNANKTGASFTVTARLDNKTNLILPGENGIWPHSILVNEKPALITNNIQQKPALFLNTGTYKISGKLSWKEMPHQLVLPPQISQLKLTVNGKVVSNPVISGNHITLRQQQFVAPQKTVQDSAKLQVFRLITDSTPATITTHLRLTVTGSERDIKIEPFHLENTTPKNYSGRLPVKRNADGSYNVRATAGVHSLSFTDRYVGGRLNTLILHQVPWGEEVWAFQPAPELRLAEITADMPLNPDQTDIPNQWRKFAAYLVKERQGLAFNTLREGAPTPAGNSLNLKRDMWLAMDGSNIIARDYISGSMNSGWRLDMGNGALSRVNIDGKAQPITKGAGDKVGIEVRKNSTNIEAHSILPLSLWPISTALIPIGAWTTDFHHASAQLSMPTAWRPIAISGAPKTSGTWLSQWNLYQFFLILLITALAYRLWRNPLWAAVAFSATALAFHDHETLATQIIVLLILGIILNTLPKKARLYKSLSRLRIIALGILVLFALPFTLLHLQNARYPHLAKTAMFSVGMQSMLMSQPYAPETTAASPAMDMLEEDLEIQSNNKPAARKMMMRSRAENSFTGLAKEEMQTADLTGFDPDARVPTGTGIPNWHGNNVKINWPNGVNAGDNMRIWLLSPTGFRLVELLKIVLFGLLLFKLFSLSTKDLKMKLNLKNKFLSAVLLGLFITMSSGSAMATDFPSNGMLNDLKDRLLEPAKCAPNCANANAVMVEAKDDSITINLEVHANADVLTPLPTLAPLSFPSAITVGGIPALTIIVNGQPHIRLKTGEHKIQIRYHTGQYNNLTLNLGQNINSFTSKLDNWRLGGLNYKGMPSNRNLTLSRAPKQLKNGSSTTKEAIVPLTFDGFANVVRTINLGNTWRVTTQVTLAGGAPFTMDLPLLAGEKLLDKTFIETDGKVRINISQRTITLYSEIEPTNSLQLTAANTPRLHEQWRLAVSPKWHVSQTAGIAPIYHQQYGQWQPLWQPHPSDSLTLNVKRPQGVIGQEMTIHNVDVNSSIRGKNRTDTANITIETTKPHTHTITLPTDINLKSFTVNGRKLSVRANEEGKPLDIGIPLNYGMNNINITWDSPQESLANIQGANFNLNAPFVNAKQTITGLSDRWVLWTYGPDKGPYVKLWSTLLGMILLALVMVKVGGTPLTFTGWLVLALGFTQSSPALFLLPVAWLLLLNWRKDKGSKLSRIQFNFLQVTLVILGFMVISALFEIIQTGLLGTPLTYIEGNGSSPYMLRWYQDMGEGKFIEAGTGTLPILAFRILMMGWALWAVLWLMTTARWSWECFTKGGYWIKKDEKIKSKK